MQLGGNTFVGKYTDISKIKFTPLHLYYAYDEQKLYGFKDNGDHFLLAPTEDFSNLPTFENDEDAIAGGLAEGYLYIDQKTKLLRRVGTPIQDLLAYTSIENLNENVGKQHPIVQLRDITINETITELHPLELQGNRLYLKFTHEDGVQQVTSIDLSGLNLTETGIANATYDASTNVITLEENSGDIWRINLSEFSIINDTNVDGITTLTQEGVVKLTVSRVGQTGDFNHLSNTDHLETKTGAQTKADKARDAAVTRINGYGFGSYARDVTGNTALNVGGSYYADTSIRNWRFAREDGYAPNNGTLFKIRGGGGIPYWYMLFGRGGDDGLDIHIRANGGLESDNPWRRLLTDADLPEGGYVKKSGDTMTGDLNLDQNKLELGQFSNIGFSDYNSDPNLWRDIGNNEGRYNSENYQKGLLINSVNRRATVFNSVGGAGSWFFTLDNDDGTYSVITKISDWGDFVHYGDMTVTGSGEFDKLRTSRINMGPNYNPRYIGDLPSNSPITDMYDELNCQTSTATVIESGGAGNVFISMDSNSNNDYFAIFNHREDSGAFKKVHLKIEGVSGYATFGDTVEAKEFKITDGTGQNILLDDGTKKLIEDLPFLPLSGGTINNDAVIQMAANSTSTGEIRFGFGAGSGEDRVNAGGIRAFREDRDPEMWQKMQDIYSTYHPGQSPNPRARGIIYEGETNGDMILNLKGNCSDDNIYFMVGNEICSTNYSGIRYVATRMNNQGDWFFYHDINLYGQIISENGYKVVGGTGDRVLLDDGTTKLLSELGSNETADGNDYVTNGSFNNGTITLNRGDLNDLTFDIGDYYSLNDHNHDNTYLNRNLGEMRGDLILDKNYDNPEIAFKQDGLTHGKIQSLDDFMLWLKSEGDVGVTIDSNNDSAYGRFFINFNSGTSPTTGNSTFYVQEDGYAYITNGYKIIGGTGQNVLLDNGQTKPLSELGGGSNDGDGNNYVSSADFTNGSLFIYREGLGTIAVNFGNYYARNNHDHDGRYARLTGASFTGTVSAPRFNQSSLRKLKKNIKPFQKDALELVDSLDIVTYDLKDGKGDNQIGVIADDTKDEFLSEEKDGVDLYKMVSIQAKAIQELKNEITELKKIINNG